MYVHFQITFIKFERGKRKTESEIVAIFVTVALAALVLCVRWR